MRNMSPALVTFLNTGTQFIMVDLFEFVLWNGTVMRYCSSSQAVTYGGNTYLPAPAGLTRSNVRWVTGVEVDTMDVIFQSDASITIGPFPMLKAAVNGAFDNARVTVRRLFMSDWQTPVDAVLLFAGNAAAATVQRQAVHMTVKSDLERLNIQMPANLYQASCVHTLYDIGCAVNKAAFTVTGSATSIGADGRIFTALTQPDNYFQMGAIKMLTGSNAGFTRTVKLYQSSVIYLGAPFPYLSSAGDQFEVAPGCDKLRSGDCLNKYNNQPNFKGFPIIPVPETAA